MCLAAKGWLQGRAAKLLRARRKSRCNEDLGQICLAANGSLVEAESVGGAVPPFTCPGALATKLSRRAGPAWRGICSPGTKPGK